VSPQINYSSGLVAASEKQQPSFTDWSEWSINRPPLGTAKDGRFFWEFSGCELTHLIGAPKNHCQKVAFRSG